MPKVIDLTNGKDFKNALKNNKLVVVDFYATWCGPCKLLTPKLHEMAEKYADRAIFYSVDVDKLDTISDEYDIRSLPTVLFFSKGETTNRVEGNDPKEIDRLLSLK